MRSFRILPLLSLFLVIATTFLIYLPGLHGSFLFDDYANLPSLGNLGPTDNWPAFWRYITSGIADPTGRPLALLSFLIDSRDWPADPFPFKRTSLLLHLFNGVLLASLLHRLGHAWIGRFPRDEVTRKSVHGRITWAAVLGASLWLLHPLFVSTTLYIVQRESMLPATFVMIGLLAWLHGRSRCQSGRWRTGISWCLIGLVGCTALAVLSKANGALLPLLALLIERILLPSWQVCDSVNSVTARRAVRSYSLVSILALWLPSAIVITWLICQGVPDILAGNTHGRPWTIGQRLLTEPRVLVDYLRLLWLPHPYTSGLFNDQFIASNSLLNPPSTLFAILTVVGLLGWSIAARKRWPPLSLAILFFFGGQLIESTILPLELYFEHRNYLPALLFFWPLSLWICGVPQHLPDCGTTASNIRVLPRVAVALALVTTLAAMTHVRADLWGNTREQALLWARLNPTSPRAQAIAAQVQSANGHPELTIQPLRNALAKAPTEVQLALNLFSAECQVGQVSSDTFSATQLALSTTRNPGALLTQWFERAIAAARTPSCRQADYHHIGMLLNAVANNPGLMANPGRRQDLAFLQGRLALAQGQGELALLDFNQAIDQQVRIEAALNQAALLGAAGYPNLGLSHLLHYDAKARSGEQFIPPFGMPRIHAWVLHQQGYWEGEEERLRATLLEDARNPGK